MSVRLNLLPDIRQQKLRDKRRKQLVTISGVIVCSVAVGVMVVLALVNGAQKYTISELNKKIESNKTSLTSITGLTDALTAEQQLSALPDLDKKRVLYSKFFSAYNSISPGELSLNTMALDGTNILKIDGTSTTYSSVAKLATAMAAENVTLGAGAEPSNAPYFSNISIDQVTKDDSGKVSFSISTTVATGATSAN